MTAFFAILYSLLPIVNSWAFLPQVVKLYKSTPIEIRSVSLMSWIIWLAGSVVTLMYGLTNLHDPLFCAVASVSVFWNVTIISLTLWKRREEIPSFVYSSAE